MKSRRLTCALLFLCLGLAVAPLSAVPLPFPSPTIVLGTNVFSGPSFLVATPLLPTDTLGVMADGTVCLQTGGLYCTNAAGVIVSIGTPPSLGGGIGGSLPVPSGIFTGLTHGSLVLGNPILGWFQVFPTTPANGAGSPTPPTSLSIHRTIGSLFGGGIAGNTTLEWRIADTVSGDNSGSFVLTDISGVPEPTSILLFGAGLVGLAFWRRRQA